MKCLPQNNTKACLSGVEGVGSWRFFGEPTYNRKNNGFWLNFRPFADYTVGKSHQIVQ